MKFISVAIFAAFFCVVYSTQDLELFSSVESISQKIEDESISLLEDHLPQLPLPPFLLRLKCRSRAYDLGVRGSKYQEIFDKHREDMWALVDNIQDICVKIPSKIKAAVCIGKNLKTYVPTLGPFLKQVKIMKEELKSQPELSAKVDAELAKCDVAAEPKPVLIPELSNFITEIDQIELLEDHLPQIPLPPFLRKLKCRSRAFDLGVRGTKYQEIFDKHRVDMWALVDNIQDICIKIPSKIKAAVCIGKNLKTYVPTLGPFLKQVKIMKEELKSQPELAAKVEAELAKCNV